MGFAPSSMKLTSSAFEDRGAIPKKHSQEGDNLSPPMVWSDAPEGTQAFAVVCHDPDAPLVTPAGQYGFVHWVLYGIPGTVSSLAEGTSEFVAGKNETGNLGYTGPMPPNGHGVHHYFFWVLALAREVDLPPGLTLWELLAKIEPDVIGMNRLVGTYQRD
jgi:Raf kinase inhibitor-like YbhB/YbcL family protein